jgi:hypothetical protein
MTLSIMTLRIMGLFVTLNITVSTTIMLSVEFFVMLSVTTLNAIMLNVIMQNVVAPIR